MDALGRIGNCMNLELYWTATETEVSGGDGAHWEEDRIKGLRETPRSILWENMRDQYSKNASID